MKGHLTLIEQMKTKNFYIGVAFIVATSASIWLLNYPSPSIRTIVTKTHNQINNIKNLPSNMQRQSIPELDVDPMYLHELGFTDRTILISNNGAGKKLLPVIASGVQPGKFEEAVHFMRSVQKYMSPRQLIMIDLGLSKSEKLLLRKHCNSSWNCLVRLLNFEKYPSHVQYLDIKSYRPVCIQELLNEYGAVIWADTSEYFLTSKINQSLTQAQTVGVVAWTIDDPTSSLTHPKMFQYFKTKQDDYFFHRAVEANHLIVYNTERVHRDLMLPWVKCALLEECINPTGAQNVGCNYYRKPLFKYSGCHRYDMSALNVVLGLLFNFKVRQYSAKEKLFGTLNKSGKNITSPHLMSRLSYS